MSDFARLLSFEGRARRSTFWWAAVGAALVVLAPVSTDGLLGLLGLPTWSPTAVLDGPEVGWATWQQLLSLIYLVAVLPAAWLLLAALVRRCHDRNWSGAFLLVGLIPVVQLWALVELGLLDGAPGDNSYGPSPKLAAADVAPMRLEPETQAQTQTQASTVVEDPFVSTSPSSQPAPDHKAFPDYRFDEAPLTLDSASEVELGQPGPPRDSHTPLIFLPLVKYARFDGRATRSEYWLFALLQWLLIIGVVFGLVAVLPPGSSSVPFVVMGVSVVVIVLLVPNLAVTSRRLHDSGLSFAWWLISFIPVIGGLIHLVLMCLGGTRGGNAYGPNPRHA